jgi:integrase
MARTVKDTKLDSRAARDRLEPRARPYYKQLIPGQLHLGYRRRYGGRGAQGRWLVRRYIGLDANSVGRYREADIGLADDFRDADGETILNYAQAQARALEYSDKNDGKEKPTGPLTVRTALDRYLTALEHQGRPVTDARLRANLHILPSLGSELVDNLTTERLRRWLADIAKLPPRIRQKAGITTPRFRLVANDDDESKRRRRSTANRTLTILKAALNHAFDEGHAKSNTAWGRRLAPFRQADAPRTRHLTVAEARRLVNASNPPEFRNLLAAGLQTGCRYGELVRLKCSDFSVDSGTLAIWQSKTGKPRHVHLTAEGAAFFKQLTAGRDGSELMLRKPDGSPWGKSEQARPMADAVERAKISPTVSFHALRHSYASLAVMNGVPLHVVARNLGHADTRMVERHYGHLTDSYLKEAIRKGAPTFGFAKGSKVVPLDKAGAT